MEKIKNLIHPGSKKDDEVLYGSGKNGDPVHDERVAGNPLTGNETGAIDSTRQSTEPTSSSPMPGTFDDDTATTASVKSGVIGESQEQSGLTGSGETVPPSNKQLSHEPEPAGTGPVGHSGVGPHDSKLANKADPRVDSDLDGSKALGGSTSGTGSGLTGTSLPDRSVGSSGYGGDSTTGTSHLSRDAALGAGPTSHHQREGQEIGGESGRTFPLSGSSTTDAGTTEPGLGSSTRGIGPGTGPTTGTSHQGSLDQDVPLSGAYNEDSWKHDHSHQFGGDPCGGPEASAPGAPHFSKGPHALDTANRLDPHVNAGIGVPTGSTNTGSSSTTGAGLGSSKAETGIGSTTPSTALGSSTSGDRHLGRDAALAGGVGAAGVGAYESSRDGTSSTTAGPHSSNLANKVDPRVDSDRSAQHGTSNAGLGSGVTGSSSTTAEPHSSNIANKADPRVDSDLSGQRGTTTIGSASGVVGSPAEGTSLPSDIPSSGKSTGSGHHMGRDAGLGGTTDPSSTSRTRTNDPVGTSKDRHYGRDAGLAGAGGLAAYEGEKHLGGSNYDPSHPTQPSTGASPATGALYDSGNGPTTGISQKGIGHHDGRDTGVAGAGGAAAYEPDKHLPGKTDRSAENYPTDTSTGKDHHYGRDAAIGAGGAGLVGTAYEAEKRRAEPSSTTGDGAYDSREPSSAAGAGAYNTREPAKPHTGRDAALAGGVGAGAGALAGEELSKKDLKQQEKEMEKEHKHQGKEMEKEQKAHQKEIEKEQKTHQKEIAKEQKAEHKAHDKAVAKEEKAHEKEVAKAEKKHEKETAKEEKHEEKKHHGGILGLFKREKHDDELKKEELQRKGEVEPDISRDGAAGAMQNPELTHSHHGSESAAGADTGVSAYEQHKRAGDLEGMSEADKLQQARHHDRNRLHKDPPPGYIEKKMEEQGSGSTGGQQTLPDGRVLEPRTGLPTDLSKGDTSGGVGGTDSTPVPGYHSTPIVHHPEKGDALG